MKKSFKHTLIVFLTTIISFVYCQKIIAQHTPPSPYSSNAPINFIRTWDATAPEQDPNNLMGRSLKDVKMATQYLDGLGRPLQTVIKQGSMVTGTAATDMVSPVEYDQFGREQYKWLPFSANNTGGNTHITDGAFKLNPFAQQATFMTAQYASQNETFFYSKTNFEASPLNRTTDTYAQGNSWAGSESNSDPAQRRNMQMKYYINTTTDAVRIWSVTNSSTIGQFGTYATTSTYPAGELYKNIAVDEHKKQVIEFKDKEGKVILKKVQLTATADDGTGANHDNWLCTYYIYDDFGNLRCVIQPEGVKAIVSTWTLTTALLNEQCFRYEYDQRNRMTMKKVTGASEVYLIYDARDRLIMTQDANMRQGTVKWMVTKYDDLNRTTETGLWTNSTSFSTHLSSAYSSTNYPATTSGYEQLTLTHYDDYSNLPSGLSATYLTTWNSNFSATNNATWPYPQMPTQSSIVKELPTWTQVKVLGTSNTYLYSVTIYDDKGRPIQVQSTNITGGTDVTTTQYSWAGQALVNVQKTEKAGTTNLQTHTIITKMQYDDLGRLLEIKKTVNSTVAGIAVNKPEQLIVSNQYDALGQLKNKKLAPSNGTNGLENLNYDYNIRGWMLGANRDYVKDVNNTNYFGFDLGYENNGVLGSYVPQYNGNIGGTLWKSKGDGEKRKYDFSYDNANRLLAADFNQYVSGSGSGAVFNKNAQIDFSVKMGSNGTDPLSAYDANGNIKKMQQWGLKINVSPQIDNLTYDYQTNSNKLAKVTDANNDPTTKLGDFKDGINSGDDYSYDVNGNLVTDQNKKILSIQYNHLNLPQVINVEPLSSWPYGSRSITYTYDAVGNKLQKQVYEVPAFEADKTITTTYINGLVFDSKTAHQGGSPEPDDHTDVLQFIPQEEGRIRFKPSQVVSGTTIPASFEYDYMIKDHLGNVRMVLTEEQQQDVYPAVTLENVTYNGGLAVNVEGQYYTIDNSKIVSKSSATGITTYQNNNGNPPYNNNPYSNATANSDKLYKLNANTNKTGLGITLKVMAGDKLDIFGKSYYFTNSPGSSYNSAIPILDLLGGFLGSPGASSVTGIHGGVTATDINTTGGVSGINSMLSSQTSESNANPTVPKAYINYLFFDEQFKCVGSGFSKVGSNSVIKDHYSQLQNLTAPKNGFVYIYCSNESPVDVFFDNLQVVHTRSPILEETHYYPFGLVQQGISSKAAGSLINRKKYNGKELQSQEFSDGSGLELYDYGARMQDPQIGRWFVIDPMSEKFNNASPYLYGNNNPISNIDVGGKYAVSVHYDISYKELIKLGYSKEKADLIAHYSSTYADHPTQNVLTIDASLHFQSGINTVYRWWGGIDYTKTAQSQDEKNSMWHSMMSDKEKEDGMTESQAMHRGLGFGWDNIFEYADPKKGGDLGKLGQGLHALQDAIAHKGASTNDHLGFNFSSFGKFANDIYGSRVEAANLTRSALIVVDVLQGKKTNLKDGDNLDLRGMSSQQTVQFLQGLVKLGFSGRIYNK